METNNAGKTGGDARLENEIRHGKYISGRGAGDVWERNTAAGMERWRRRVCMLTEHVKPAMQVLEVGCGVGYLTKELANTGAAIVAIDVSPDLIALARADVRADNVEFMVENAYSTRFPAERFDIIIGSSVLHHLDVLKALPEFYRILKTGGSIYFTEPNMLNPQIMVQKNIPFIKKLMGDSPDETAFYRWVIKRKLKDAGFEDTNIVPFDFMHPRIPKGLLGAMRPLCLLAEKVPLLSEIAGSLYITARK